MHSYTLPDSDREESGSKQDGLVVAPKQMSSGLGSLVANYGSMTESDSDEEPEGEFQYQNTGPSRHAAQYKYTQRVMGDSSLHGAYLKW